MEEAREHLERLNSGLVVLEKNPEDPETINTVFRSAHTIKGSSRMMKLTAISEVAHRMEDVLGALREKKIGHSKELADLLFMGADAMTELIEKAAAGEEIAADTSSVCERLRGASEGNLERPGPSPEAAPGGPEKPCPGPLHRPAADSGAKTIETVRIKAEKLDKFINLLGEIVSNRNRLKQRLFDAREIGEAAGKGATVSGEGAAVPALCAAVKQFTAAFKDDIAINGLLVTELQQMALTMRMVPLSTIFDSLGRIARDISAVFGKEVDFSAEGGDIELDKKMIEHLGDPLIHMLRNSVDHGIETPGERLEAGKPAMGRVRLSAAYGAGSVLIELADDGRGISIGKIKEKALKKNILSPEALNEMPDAALLELIYHPGFSTSSIITDVSGRGVGMDIVKKNIVETLQGTIKVETSEGKGTTFSIRLPLTLAIMRVLLFETAGVVFGVSANHVTEILRGGPADLIKVIDRKAIRLREEIIPVVDLRDILAMAEDGGERGGDLLIAIVQMGNEKLGLILDELLDEENMVIKPLPGHMRNIKFVSGVTVSGRNEIINILHVPALMEASKKAVAARSLRVREKGKEEINILVVDDSVSTREIEKSILEANGYSVSLAEDGIKALQKTKEFKYDLVITDVEMPRLDGFSLTERLRSDENYKDIPVIMVTSRQKEEDKRRGIAAGADAYIVKGAFDQTNLLETIRNLIG